MGLAVAHANARRHGFRRPGPPVSSELDKNRAIPSDHYDGRSFRRLAQYFFILKLTDLRSAADMGLRSRLWDSISDPRAASAAFTAWICLAIAACFLSRFSRACRNAALGRDTIQFSNCPRMIVFEVLAVYVYPHQYKLLHRSHEEIANKWRFLGAIPAERWGCLAGRTTRSQQFTPPVQSRPTSTEILCAA
jgi:hypothetical protein